MQIFLWRQLIPLCVYFLILFLQTTVFHDIFETHSNDNDPNKPKPDPKDPPKEHIEKTTEIALRKTLSSVIIVGAVYFILVEFLKFKASRSKINLM